MHFTKFSLAFIFLIFAATIASAQNPLKKGVYNIKGSLGLSIRNHEDDYSKSKYTMLWFQPSYGYFLTDNLLVSGLLAFNYNEFEYNGKNSPAFLNISRYYNAGVNFRYYFNSELIIPFVGIGASYSKRFNNEQDGKEINITCGINYFIGKEVAIEPYAAYYISYYNNPKQNLNNFMVGVGINYYITK